MLEIRLSVSYEVGDEGPLTDKQTSHIRELVQVVVDG